MIVAIETLLGLKTRQGRSKSTLEIIEEKGAQLCRFFGPDRDVGTLRLTDTTAYVQRRREQRVSDSTIAKEMGTLRSALRYLVRLELYDRLPDALWPPELAHGSGTRDAYLSWPTGYLAVLGALAAEWRDHYVVWCHTGMRHRELHRLEAHHVGDHLGVPGTKTPKAVRWVPVNEDVREVLERRVAAHPTGPLFPLARKDLNSERSAWLRDLKEACRRAGQPACSTNDLRRSFATWARDRGVEKETLVEWMGHETSKMLDRVYVQITPEKHEREAAKMPSRKARKR